MRRIIKDDLDERRRFLIALYTVRALLVGHVVKAEHIRKSIETIDKAIMAARDDI